MNKRHLLIGLVLNGSLILLFLACQHTPQGSLKIRKAASYILQYTDNDSVVWRLMQIYDPYNGGQIIQKSNEEATFLILRKNGTFQEYDQENNNFGKWYVDKTKSSMALIYTTRNGKEVKENPIPDFRHQIRKFNKDTLILAWQGRHGFVEQLYTRVQEK